MKRVVAGARKIVEENFSQAFEENPKVKTEFNKDLDAMAKDTFCQQQGNNCRAKLLSLSIYYYQQFRHDIPGCQVNSPALNSQCESELKFRKSSLNGVTSGYGMKGPGSYKKELMETKNKTTTVLFNIIMPKDKNNLHICQGVQRGTVHHYALDMNDPGDYWVGLDPHHNPVKNIPKECVEEKISLHSEFIPTSFDEWKNNSWS